MQWQTNGFISETVKILGRFRLKPYANWPLMGFFFPMIWSLKLA
jgi:hypothetical protein